MKSFYGLMLLMIWAGLEITEVVSAGKFDFGVFDVNGDGKLDKTDLDGLSNFAKFKDQFTDDSQRNAIIEVLTSVLGSGSISSSEWESTYKATIKSNYDAKIKA